MNTQNPDAYGRRDIPRLMKQAKVQFADKKKDNYRTPTPKARLLVLVQFLMQQRSSNNAGTTRSVKLEYNSLRSHAKDVHARMVQEQQKKLNNRGRSVRLALHTLKWSEFDKETKKKYALELEQVARDCGLNLHRCVDSWAALLLLADVCRNRHAHPPQENGSIPVASSSRALPPASVQASKRDGSVVSSTESETDQLGDHSPSPPSSPSPSPSPSPLPPKRQNKGKGKAPSKSRSKGKGKRKEQEVKIHTAELKYIITNFYISRYRVIPKTMKSCEYIKIRTQNISNNTI